MHVSGSRVMDKCTICMCIMIKNICIAHAYIHQSQESYIHAYMHHGHMYQDQEHMHRTCIQTSGSRIIHTCMLQDQRCMHHTLMHQAHPTPRIALFVGPSPKSFASWMHEPFVHHTCMNQGSRNIDTCMYQDQGS